MIVYNSHHASSLLRITGSVLPEAMKWAAGAGIAALILKYIEKHIMSEGLVGDLEISPAAFSGFSFTLGFVIVFRTSQCYNRFWQCTIHVNHMRAEWYEAASALTTFITMSPKSLDLQDNFSHKVIRYLSLMHSLALQSLLDGSETFPAIDLESLPDESLKHVLDTDADADTMTANVELVYQWIQALIVQSMNEGLLNVPPPILTRVLQMLSSGMVHYRSVLDIISIPFPFPYAQVTFILLTFYVCFVPIVMCLLVNEPWIACLCGFLSVLCLITVDLVSTEIENPFGQDPNDLPCHEFQHKMNNSLIALMHPSASSPPELGPNAKLSFKELVEAQASLTIINMNNPTFHGGKVKPPKQPVEPKPIPDTKESKPQVESTQTSTTLAGGGQRSVSERSPTPSEIQASGDQGYAQKLIMQQATMLGEFVQSNGAVLERMDRTLHTLTAALTQQLSSLSELQTRQVMAEMVQREGSQQSGQRRPSNSMAGEEVPSCFSISAMLPYAASRPGVQGAPDPSASVSNGVVQVRRS